MAPSAFTLIATIIYIHSVSHVKSQWTQIWFDGLSSDSYWSKSSVGEIDFGYDSAQSCQSGLCLKLISSSSGEAWIRRSTDVSQYESLRIQISVSSRNMESGEYCEVHYSYSSGSTSSMERILQFDPPNDGGRYYFWDESVDLPSAASASTVWIWLVTAATTNDMCYWDNIYLYGTPVSTVDAPTPLPTKKPTDAPTLSPTNPPSRAPSHQSSDEPSNEPSKQPSRAHTSEPTVSPTTTTAPTQQPTETPIIDTTKPETKDERDTATTNRTPTNVNLLAAIIGLSAVFVVCCCCCGVSVYVLKRQKEDKLIAEQLSEVPQMKSNSNVEMQRGEGGITDGAQQGVFPTDVLSEVAAVPPSGDQSTVNRTMSAGLANEPQLTNFDGPGFGTFDEQTGMGTDNADDGETEYQGYDQNEEYTLDDNEPGNNNHDDMIMKTPV